MIAFICNRCKKPIDLKKKHCAHLYVSFGERAIESMGKYGNGYNADLCEECYESISRQIDCYYYGGNAYLESEVEANEHL